MKKNGRQFHLLCVSKGRTTYRRIHIRSKFILFHTMKMMSIFNISSDAVRHLRVLFIHICITCLMGTRFEDCGRNATGRASHTEQKVESTKRQGMSKTKEECREKKKQTNKMSANSTCTKPVKTRVVCFIYIASLTKI